MGNIPKEQRHTEYLSRGFNPNWIFKYYLKPMFYDVIFIVIKFINEIGVDILSLDFGMKEFSDFELLR